MKLNVFFFLNALIVAHVFSFQAVSGGGTKRGLDSTLEREDFDIYFEPKRLDSGVPDWKNGEYRAAGREAPKLLFVDNNARTERALTPIEIGYLERIVELSRRPTKANTRKIFEITSNLAQGGHVSSQFELARLLWEKGDKKAALHWFESAASSNHPDACLFLGDYYVYNENHPRAAIIALGYYWRVAVQNRLDAYFRMGDLYRNGFEYKAECIRKSPEPQSYDFITCLESRRVQDNQLAIQYYMLACRTNAAEFAAMVKSPRYVDAKLMTFLTSQMPFMASFELETFKEFLANHLVNWFK